MSESKKTQCLRALRTAILSTELAPGSDLDENRLAERYGLSRTPLREVLQRLDGEGYVSITSNRGAKVSSMDLSTLRIFFQTAPLVYASSARLAAENRTQEQLGELKEIQADFLSATQGRNASRAALLNHAFHDQIGAMGHNPYLRPALNRMLIDHTRLSQTFYRPASPGEHLLVQKACDQHDQMILAIEAQEPALAVDLTLQHWDLSRDRMERYVRPDPLPLDVLSLKEHRDAV
ncbi:MAG: GntR family transcriptional regulator [Pseudomonadota bacterium]